MTMVNASALFSGLVIRPSFTNAIHIRAGDDEDKLLREARSKIRQTLRTTFKDLTPVFLSSELKNALFEDRSSEFRDIASAIRSLDIRFLTQGSFAYKTLIRPAVRPAQEIDLDDGVYLPMPFVRGRPAFSSRGLFMVITKALRPLIDAEGWSFYEKDTCLRILLTGTGAHIDLPLFAVEISSFKELESVYQMRTGKELRSTTDLNEVLDSTAKSIRLNRKNLLLAHRTEDWLISDPKALHDWFVAQVERHGPVLRRLCRYTKAWRDNTWDKCSMSSLALMVACVETLNELESEVVETRDDLLMLKVAEELPKIIRRGRIVWREGETPLDSNWSNTDREEFAKYADALYSEMNLALNRMYIKESVVKHLRNCFGERFPNAPESVTISPKSQEAAIRSSVAATVPLARTKPSISG